MEKTIYLKAPLGTNIILAVIGLVFLLSGIYSFVYQSVETKINYYALAYSLLGINIFAVIFRTKLFGNKKFIRLNDEFIEIKRWAITKLIKIKIDEINEIKFIASRVSIKYANTQELINLDWISSGSRKELSLALEKLAEEKAFPYEIVNIFDKFKGKEL
jgi:hypothetical protein